MSDAESRFCEKFFEVNQPYFHSASFSEFAEYCRMGGVVARSFLTGRIPRSENSRNEAESRSDFAPDRITGHLSDPSDLFWNLESGVPNPEGPITLVFNSDIFRCMDRMEVIRTTPDQLFKPVNNPDLLYDGKLLRSEYSETQVHCIAKKLPLQRLKYILIDPFEIQGRELKEWAFETAEEKISGLFRPQKFVRRRTTVRAEFISELEQWSTRIADSGTDIPCISENAELVKSCPATLSTWLASLDEKHRIRLAIWLRTFYLGTVVPIRRIGLSFE